MIYVSWTYSINLHLQCDNWPSFACPFLYCSECQDLLFEVVHCMHSNNILTIITRVQTGDGSATNTTCSIILLLCRLPWVVRRCPTLHFPSLLRIGRLIAWSWDRSRKWELIAAWFLVYEYLWCDTAFKFSNGQWRHVVLVYPWCVHVFLSYP